MPTSNAAFRALVESIDTLHRGGPALLRRADRARAGVRRREQRDANMIASMYQSAAGLSSSFGSQYASANLQQAAQNWLNVSGNGNGWTTQQVIQEIAGLIQGGTGSNPADLPTRSPTCKRWARRGPGLQRSC
jgi:hypothetical protein